MKNIIILSLMLAVATPVFATVESDNPSVIKNDSQNKNVKLIVKFKNTDVHKSLLTTKYLNRNLKRDMLTHEKSASFDSKKFNVNTDISSEVGTSQLDSMNKRHNVKFNHVRSMSFESDVIEVESTESIDTKLLISQMLDSGEYDSISIDIEVKGMSYNDPKYNEQKYLHAHSPLNVYGQNYTKMKAQTVNNLGRHLRVGIIDSGYMPHEDINDPVGGYDWVDDDEDALDLTSNEGGLCHDGHGLAVGGLIAAKSNNGLGVTGVMDSEQVDLYYGRVLDCSGNGKNSDILDAVAWMIGESVPGVPDIENPVDVIALPLGGYSVDGCTDIERDVFVKARGKGITVVVPAGNENIDTSNIVPASCNDVVVVGATNTAGDKATFSNWGDKIDVFSAGDSLWMISDEDHSGSKYFRGSGSTYSTANVTGGIGNLLLTYPTLTPEKIESLLKANARKFDEGTICGQLGCGAGVVDMGELISAIPNITSSKSFNKSHRYQGFDSPEQEVWLAEMNKYANSCTMLKYTWGDIGTKLAGVSYNLFISDTEDITPVLIETPEKFYNHSDDTVINVKTCVNGACGGIIPMVGDVVKPISCI